MPPTKRLRAHHRVNPYPATRRQNETEMFSYHYETGVPHNEKSLYCWYVTLLLEE